MHKLWVRFSLDKSVKLSVGNVAFDLGDYRSVYETKQDRII